jgi:acyl-CoA synthetase (AMP-forming)/AMP-acid ligase II
MDMFADGATSIGARLRHWARIKPDDLALIFLADGESECGRVNFGQLHEQAQRLSGRLIRAGLSGHPVLLPAHSTADFVVAVCGCLCAGVIAVPCPFQHRSRGSARVASIARDAGVRAIVDIADASSSRFAEVVPDIPLVSLGNLNDEIPAAAHDDPQRPALLQYTSGSTGAPKGVVVTNRNLSANIAMLSRAFGVRPDSRVLTWLPLFHDMGLIGNLLAALFCGVSCTVMPSRAFLQKPLRWLEAIGRYGITISGAPNFAYELCARRVGSGPVDHLDLTTWKLAVCAAEPVRLSTVRRFTGAFARCGFSEKAFYPCYGLAEATVFVSGGELGEGVKAADAECAAARSAVNCGRPAAGTSVRMVDPETCNAVPDGTEGEIWVRGEHVAAGYWNNPGATAATFTASITNCQSHYLRTGDLGVMWRGDIHITGRRKDLIIYRGTNLHPEDVEATIAASDDAFGPAGAAFAVEADEEEQVVAVFELASQVPAKPQAEAMIERALKAVAADHGVRLFDLVLLRAGVLPRTTSGKIHRDECRRLYTSGELARGSFYSRHLSLGRYQKNSRAASATAL